MKKVHLWFQNHISKLNEELANADSFEKQEIEAELKEAWQMQLLVSDLIDWDEKDENDEFCHNCDWHGSCQSHPKE